MITSDVIIHACNSAAAIRLPQAHFDMIRCGIAVYGYCQRPQQYTVNLKPALRMETSVIHLNSIKKGQTVSYGRKFTADKDIKTAILPIGYSDGFCRCFTNNASVIINNQPAEVIGAVTMNQIAVNVTDINGVVPDSRAVVIDDNYNSPCGVYKLAEKRKTISYEILTSVPAWAEKIIE